MRQAHPSSAMEPRSQNWLAWILHMELAHLKAIAKDPQKHYRRFEHRTTSGKVRPIAEPDPVLKRIQKRIVSEILRPRPMLPCVQGSIRRRSPRTNAAVHRGQPVIVRIDIQNFFPNVKNRMVYGTWVEVFGYGRALASLLTKLTTLDGHLPQGTPTSSYLANLVLRKADEEIQTLADGHNLRYTRFVDDVVLSGFRAREVIDTVVREISRAGFRCKRTKLNVAGPRSQRLVTGYTVDTISVPRKERDRLKAAIRQLERRSTSGLDVSKEVLSIQGRLAHVAQSNPGAAQRLQQQFAAAAPSFVVVPRIVGNSERTAGTQSADTDACEPGIPA